ncbi:MAG: ABC transporter substrate-binding protein [Planctomycetes bacterium]|nr:ABC transporter substrate-binding protein [Planctomycetota bacterium]MCP4772044.1 ABC transporter substrate-binding protein [Planctomycetota bacterium]MCP4860304.1 ABC transporter substrate-binding protein [Planctomycetota bacterium]
MANHRAYFTALFLGILAIALSACSKSEPVKTTHGSASIPQRAVVIGPATAANLFALGAGQHVIAVSDYNTIEAAKELPRVGGLFDPNIERITALNPDLVLIQGQANSLQGYCEASGIEFRSFSTDTLAAWRTEMEWLAQRFDVQEQLPAQLQRMSDGLAALTASESSNATPPRVLLVISRRADEASSIMVAGHASFLNELLVHAGGQNVFTDNDRDYFDLNEESLIRAAPDVILEFSTDTTAQDALAVWRKAFPEVPAVRDGRIRVIAQEDALMPGPSMLETAQAIALELQE